MQRRGVTPDLARAIMRTNTTAIGAVMVHRGDADSLICGTFGQYLWHLQLHPRGPRRRPDELHPVGALSLMIHEKGVVFVADTQVHPEPTPEEIADTVIAAARHVRRFGLVPKVAVCSHSQFGNLDTSSGRRTRGALAILDGAEARLRVRGRDAFRRRARPRAPRAASSRTRASRGRRTCSSSRTPTRRAAVRNIIKVVAGGLEVGPILMGMGNTGAYRHALDHRPRPAEHRRAGGGAGAELRLSRPGGEPMGYREVYEDWKADPEGFWMKAAERDRLDQPAARRPRRQPGALLRLVPGRASATPAGTPSTGTSAAGHGDRRRDHLRLARHRHGGADHLRRTAASGWRGSPARWRRAGSARATGSSSTCRWSRRRWSPCWPAPGSGRSTRSSSAASPRTSSPSASTTRGRRRSSPPPAASSRAGWCATSRWSTPRSTDAVHKPEFCLVFQRDAGAGDARRRARPRLARGAGGGGARALRAGRRHGPALHPLHLRHHRPAEGRRRDQRRPHGGARLDDEEHLRGRAGRGLLGGLGRRLGGRAFLHLLRAAPRSGRTTVVFEGKPVGTPDAGAFWRVIARPQGPELLHRPDRLPRDQARRPGRASWSKDYDLSSLRYLFLAGERADPTPSNGRGGSSACR